MYVLIWEYAVRPGREAEFERIYAPRGEWSELFGQGEGYLGTELYRDEENPQRFITIDRWASRGAFERFKQEQGPAYESLDARCEQLCEMETQLGSFTGAPCR
jgi:heme-degrading monooxygenase HmoA